VIGLKAVIIALYLLSYWYFWVSVIALILCIGDIFIDLSAGWRMLGLKFYFDVQHFAIQTDSNSGLFLPEGKYANGFWITLGLPLGAWIGFIWVARRDVMHLAVASIGAVRYLLVFIGFFWAFRAATDRVATNTLMEMSGVKFALSEDVSGDGEDI
jgi:hypothetical protein